MMKLILISRIKIKSKMKSNKHKNNYKKVIIFLKF